MSKVKRAQTKCQRTKEKRKGKIEIRERCGGEKKEKKKKRNVWIKKYKEKKNKEEEIKIEKCHNNIFTIFS